MPGERRRHGSLVSWRRGSSRSNSAVYFTGRRADLLDLLIRRNSLDCYEIWFDLKDTHRDLEFAGDLQRYMEYLLEKGLIMGHRLTRRKLGFGPAEMGE